MYLVAFKGERKVIIVVISLYTTSKEQTFTFNHGSITHINRYTTSETKNLSFDEIVDFTDNSFTATLDQMSITSFVCTITSTGVKPLDPLIQQSYNLEQNYPSPFNSCTAISFRLPSKSYVLQKIFDMMGREVAVLVNEELAAGSHSCKWDASKVSSGVYFYRFILIQF